ncbi:MarR family winged helix-turn-helix transcriptional regulator [Dyella psychrodurans]|uniref:MarR family transcriptional regulator n=1 Tax=Dyella psychrodurans TaxID=1927960 RepID=A0A370X768_9GAMM|nr:MarR family transcriptional regulator [Dyella psychrodurans]RDS84273.1 MarR family transcriptional regulator [Dyella psychrodurans]
MSKHLSDEWGKGTPNSTSPEHETAGTTTQTEADALYKMAEVSRVLRSATSTIEKLAHLVSGTSDLTLMHCLVLVHLSKAATCKQLELKSATGIPPAHLTKLLDELAHRGLVRRIRSSWDRRQIILALTEPGRETALRLLTSLHKLADKTQLDEIERLGSSLEHFVSTTENDARLDGKGEED